MRLRKNAKVSPLEYAYAVLDKNIIIKPRLCQLNQSPWDVIDFSLPPSKVNGAGYSAVNGSSGGCLPANDWNFDFPGLSEFPGPMQEVEEEHPPPAEEEILLRRRYVKKSKRPAKAAEKVAAAAPPPPPRRGRPKKAPSSSVSEFYYYSGFGPRWGKKRGECSLNNQHEKEIGAKGKEIEESKMVKFEEEEEEEEVVEVVGKKRVRKPIKARSLKSLM